MLDIVNFDRYRDKASDLLNTERSRVRFGPLERSAIAVRGETVWVVCAEGVAYPVSPQEHLELDVWVEVDGAATVFPEITLELRPSEVLGCRTGEAINLANLIDVGSSRLEENFDVIRARLELPTPL